MVLFGLFKFSKIYFLYIGFCEWLRKYISKYVVFSNILVYFEYFYCRLKKGVEVIHVIKKRS